MPSKVKLCPWMRYNLKEYTSYKSQRKTYEDSKSWSDMLFKSQTLDCETRRNVAYTKPRFWPCKSRTIACTEAKSQIWALWGTACVDCRTKSLPCKNRKANGLQLTKSKQGHCEDRKACKAKPWHCKRRNADESLPSKAICERSMSLRFWYAFLYKNPLSHSIISCHATKGAVRKASKAKPWPCKCRDAHGLLPFEAKYSGCVRLRKACKPNLGPVKAGLLPSKAKKSGPVRIGKPESQTLALCVELSLSLLLSVWGFGTRSN